MTFMTVVVDNNMSCLFVAKECCLLVLSSVLIVVQRLADSGGRHYMYTITYDSRLCSQVARAQVTTRAIIAML